MKVIDLLNKIANGEEVHFKTKLNGKEVVVNYYNDRDFSSSTGPELLTIADIIKSLNDTVEILEEEKKIPEKLNIEDDGNTITLFGEKENEWTILDNVDAIVCNKINEIIDYLKSKGE